MKQFAYENINESAFQQIICLCFGVYAETYDAAVMKVMEDELFEPMLHEGDAEYEAEKRMERMHEQDDPAPSSSSSSNDSSGDNEEEGEDLIVYPID